MNGIKTIGITGGIGSGKSYVSAILQEKFGIPVYDCDKEAKRLTASNEEIRQRLIALVGPEVFDGNKLNKQLLADYLFASQQHVQLVNAIVHPAVRDDFRKWAGRQKTGVVAMESAILYESGFDTSVDKVLFVSAPAELRIRRAMQRDGSTRQQIEARIAMQQTESQMRKARYVIDNTDATRESLLRDLRQILRNITAEGQTEKENVEY